MSVSDSNVVVSAFTEENVERLTGLSVYQLRHWDRIGFFAPSFADDNRRNAFSRIYSFSDIVSLQILRNLRNDLGVSLQHLREVKDKLDHLDNDKWSKTVLYVVKKKVVFHERGTERLREIVSGQYVLEIPLEVVRTKMERAVRNLNTRDQSKIGHIERHRRVSHNAWVISGTRIPVSTIKSYLEEGYRHEQIIAEFPELTIQDIEAAIAHDDAAVA